MSISVKRLSLMQVTRTTPGLHAAGRFRKSRIFKGLRGQRGGGRKAALTEPERRVYSATPKWSLMGRQRLVGDALSPQSHENAIAHFIGPHAWHHGFERSGHRGWRSCSRSAHLESSMRPQAMGHIRTDVVSSWFGRRICVGAAHCGDQSRLPLADWPAIGKVVGNLPVPQSLKVPKSLNQSPSGTSGSCAFHSASSNRSKASRV
jgi:hypothetical protein